MSAHLGFLSMAALWPAWRSFGVVQPPAGCVAGACRVGPRATHITLAHDHGHHRARSHRPCTQAPRARRRHEQAHRPSAHPTHVRVCHQRQAHRLNERTGHAHTIVITSKLAAHTAPRMYTPSSPPSCSQTRCTPHTCPIVVTSKLAGTRHNADTHSTVAAGQLTVMTRITCTRSCGHQHAHWASAQGACGRRLWHSRACLQLTSPTHKQRARDRRHQ